MVNRATEEIRRASLQRIYLKCTVFIGRDNNYGNGCQMFHATKSARKFRAIHSRHTIVYDNQVWSLRLQPLQGLQRNGHRFDVDVLVQEHHELGENCSVSLPIIDNQNQLHFAIFLTAVWRAQYAFITSGVYRLGPTW